MRQKQQRKEQGLCIDCGKPRGEDGTTIRCRRCADSRNRRRALKLSEIRKERRARGECTQCGDKCRGSLCRVHKVMQAQADARHYRLRQSPY